MFGLFSLVWFLLVGLGAGWIATRLMGAGGAGTVTMLVVGVVGSMVGPVLLRVIGFKTLGFPASLVGAVIGAAVCIAAIRYFGPKL